MDVGLMDVGGGVREYVYYNPNCWAEHSGTFAVLPRGGDGFDTCEYDRPPVSLPRQAVGYYGDYPSVAGYPGEYQRQQQQYSACGPGEGPVTRYPLDAVGADGSDPDVPSWLAGAPGPPRGATTGNSTLWQGFNKRRVEGIMEGGSYRDYTRRAWYAVQRPHKIGPCPPPLCQEGRECQDVRSALTSTSAFVCSKNIDFMFEWLLSISLLSSPSPPPPPPPFISTPRLSRTCRLSRVRCARPRSGMEGRVDPVGPLETEWMRRFGSVPVGNVVDQGACHARQGRGEDLVSNGDVEPNPGPVHGTDIVDLANWPIGFPTPWLGRPGPLRRAFESWRSGPYALGNKPYPTLSEAQGFVYEGGAFVHGVRMDSAGHWLVF